VPVLQINKMDFLEVIKKRRDSRHFSNEEIDMKVIMEGINLASLAPSVGQTKPTRFIIIESSKTKLLIKENFIKANKIAANNRENPNTQLYENLKLEAILDAPVGLIICCDLSELNNFSIGTATQGKEMLMASTVCAIHTLWLFLTNINLSLGWVSILDYEQLKADVDIDTDYFPLGYFCIGKPAKDYGGIPMLSEQKWNTHLQNPIIISR